jgi:dTDP-4-dehydrorhamnose 3,5-epimerase
MPLRIESRHLNEIVVLVPEVFTDERGFFMETFRADQFREIGIPTQYLQDNHTYSNKGVLRGLHFQWEPPMGKLMRVTHGAAFLVAADIRGGSATLGNWFGLEVSAGNRKQVWAPAGFATGFCALTDAVEVEYKCTALYNADGGSAIRWDDPDLAINWPLDPILISAKDRHAQTLAAWLASPLYEKLRSRSFSAIV